jgi:hypothetical protein
MTDFKGVCGSQELRQTQKIGCQTGKLQERALLTKRTLFFCAVGSK